MIPLERAYQTALSSLLAERNAAGHWSGELSSSALSTATAISALALVGRANPSPTPHASLIASGSNWLFQHQNADGGWGDTVKSFSNISTSMLVRAALHLTEATGHEDALQRLEKYLDDRCGRTPQERAEAIRRRYGKDRTFAVPILTTCALAGFISWGEVTPLPFELACFPQSWFRFLRLPVVSYALPALIAMGQAIYHHRPPLESTHASDAPVRASQIPACPRSHSAVQRRLSRSDAADQLRDAEPGQHRPGGSSRGTQRGRVPDKLRPA